jgi:type IV pilus assembly protein PilW
MIRYTGKTQRGMSVIELMIALAIGLFLTAGLISLFVNSKQSYRLNENMARLQENARFAMTFIARDIRMTDYRGCLKDGRKADALAGVNNDPKGYEDSDSISLSWQTNRCDRDIDGDGDVDKDDEEPASTTTVVYWIEDKDDGIGPRLFRTIEVGGVVGDEQELVRGIEGLMILYGEDTDGEDIYGNYAPSYYVDAGNITDMANVMSVKFTLIARTIEDNLTSSGGRITRSFSATVALRNRLP